jgi:hypothetical protein
MIYENDKNKAVELGAFKNGLLVILKLINFIYFVHCFNNQHKMIKELPLSHVIFCAIETCYQQISCIYTLMFRCLPALSGKFDSMLNDVLCNHVFEAKKN